MSKIDVMEPVVHGRGRWGTQCLRQSFWRPESQHCVVYRDLDNMDDLHFGVHTPGGMLYAKAAPPVDGAQWTGIVTRIAIAMLEAGKASCPFSEHANAMDRVSPQQPP